ncbi:SusC/RagA family TonB-linked outer membrane protein [Plebeiibacterium sediminum]|uniref:TonB-dependent receptor n=1 Tax=Plebeiibacterium sediminum TaxID=2992112 RepID=A0AAE3M277_9BACT|nr:TonB-dependent receptor [Plebeiobacterium sediminum]MCW3785774.1 TonB-dependent receptor [Plebeiobacterium sediminum]
MKNLFSLILLFALSIPLLSAQDQWSVSGNVKGEEDNEPIIGANVFVKGTTIGTVTDMDGNFTLKVEPNSIVVISMIGFQNVEKQIKVPNDYLAIVLKLDNYVLDEIVSVGYGTMKKSDLTGAVASIKSKELQKTPAAGLDQALQGKVAGVTVNANSGQPGEAAVVRIRGIGTVNNSSPIYVVDGMIVQDISFLSPNDIESTEVLKDASSTAIYGSRGANGVILIKTKKGEKGKSRVSVSSYTGVQNRWNKLDLMKRDEFAETLMKLNPKASSISKYQQEGFNTWMKDNVGTSPYYPLLKTNANPYGMDYAAIETDWQDEVFKKNAVIQDYYASFSGGDANNSYVLSASYFNQDGTVIGSNYERLTLRVNTSLKVNDWLKIGENLSFVNSTGRNAMHNSSSPGASVLSAAIAMAPWDPTHYPEGSINNEGKDMGGQIAAASNFKNVVNPFSMVKHNHPENIVERWVGDMFVELTPFKNFKWRSAISMDLANNRNRSFGDAYQYSDYDKRNKNFLSSNMQHYRTLILENIANYSVDLGKHSISLMAGQTTEEYNNYGMGGAGASILNPTESNWYLSKTTEDKTEANDNVSRTRMFSLLSRFHYSFDSRYLLTVNFRADGSNKFPENVWGYFPSMALAWRISEENWMKNFESLDFMKLRFGWGQIGNDKIASNSFATTMFESNTVFTGYPLGLTQTLANGATVLTYANKGGKWETTEQLSAGIDFGFGKGLITGSFDGFIRDTKEMLLGVKAPAQVGNRFDPLANVGTVRNEGIEISLGHSGKIGKVSYNIDGNASFIRNELTALNGGSPVYGDRTLSDEGLALYTLWGYQFEGVYKTDQEAMDHLWSYSASEIGVHAGDARYKDLSGPEGTPDGKIDDYDKTDIGNPFPWLTYGFNIGANYKGFDLQMFFQGVYGNEIYNAVRHRTEGAGNDATLSTSMRNVWVDYTDVMKTSLESYGVDWTQLVNTDGTIPNPTGNPMNRETSDRLVESGAYLRLKNMQLGYTIPKRITEKAGISRCRFYLSGSNLLTWTNYSGYDPEVGSGIDYGNYPQARTVTLGVNLDF